MAASSADFSRVAWRRIALYGLGAVGAGAAVVTWTVAAWLGWEAAGVARRHRGNFA